MAIKTHLADSAEPLKEGSKLLAICGAIIPDAAFVFMWDDAEVMTSISGFLRLSASCRKCKLLPKTGRYQYGICSGEERKQSEGE
jgi:hypothetical protein